MDRYLHKTMASIVSVQEFEILEVKSYAKQSEAKILKKVII